MDKIFAEEVVIWYPKNPKNYVSTVSSQLRLLVVICAVVVLVYTLYCGSYTAA